MWEGQGGETKWVGFGGRRNGEDHWMCGQPTNLFWNAQMRAIPAAATPLTYVEGWKQCR
jgi:hypothetical protein